MIYKESGNPDLEIKRKLFRQKGVAKLSELMIYYQISPEYIVNDLKIILDCAVKALRDLDQEQAENQENEISR